MSYNFIQSYYIYIKKENKIIGKQISFWEMLQND